MDNTLVISIFIVIVAMAFIVVVAKTMRASAEEMKTTQSKQKAKLEKRKARREEAGKTIRQIQWGDSFVVDDGVIDRDHQALFKLINQFSLNITKFSYPSHMMPYLIELKKYTQYHFRREESLQVKSRYAYADDHRQQHAATIRALDALIQKAQKANEDTVTDVALEISGFLQDKWLTDHIIEHDLPMRAAVERMRDHSRGMSGLMD
ncbi:MAG: hemerythrin family protein [Alphaproteobacteria bacterium]|nr:hemerythrin family protein [Alphaproteobacteria bacterium]MBF0249758.1 hemerythrin family protein [Alphaproteobacteria bacterium]